MVTKKEVWKKIKTMDIDFPLRNELFSMIEENLERVDFTRDHVGIRDFIFVAEEGTHYTANFFVAINVECEKTYSYRDNLILFLQKYNDNPIKALKELADFFENTDRTLYLGIGFKESDKIVQEEVVEKYLSGNYTTQEEILKDVRKFPDWYAEYAKNPEEINFITVKAERYIKEVLKPLENESLKIQLNELLDKEELTINDRALLKEMATHLTI